MKNNIITDYFKNKKIWSRLALFLIIATLIPGVAIFWIANVGINKINSDYNNKYIKASEQAAEENLKIYLERINNTYLSILINKDFFEIWENEDRADRTVRLSAKLTEFVTEYIKNIDIIDNDMKVVRVLDGDGIQPLTHEQIRLCCMEENNWKTTVTDRNGKSYYILSKKLINVDLVKNEGYIVFYIPEENICDAYSNGIIDYDSAFIVNGNGEIVSDTDKNRIMSKFFFNDIDEFATVSYNNRRYYISKYQLSGGNIFPEDWSLVQMISADKTDRLLLYLRNYLLLQLLVILIIVPLLCLILSNRVVKPIGRLQKRMVEFGYGKFSEPKKRKEKHYEDEITVFEKKFDEMEYKIRDLIVQNNKEKDKQRIAELNMLQAQINPHFIYNTLDSISWLAEANGQEDIVEIVYALSKFFEISLHNGKNYVSVEQEIEHVKSYITVEEIRFPDLFEVEFDIDGNILFERIIKIILQPIVENSIKHGIRSLEGRKGKITVSGRREGEYIIFVIGDNGVGFDVEAERPKDKKGGYGLKNISTRIKMEYGADCGISTKSVVGEGTEVTVKLRHKDRFFGEELM